MLRQAQASAPRSAAAAVSHVAGAIGDWRYQKLEGLARGLAAHVQHLARVVDPPANQCAEPELPQDIQEIVEALESR